MATASRTSIMLWHDSNIAEITCWYADVIGEVTQWHGNNINGSNIREVTKWYRGHWVRSWCQRQQLFIEQRAGLTSWELSVSQPHSGVCTLPSCRMSYTRASLVVSGFVMNFLSAQNKLPAVISISFLNEIIFLTPGDPASLPHLVTASSRPSSLENPSWELCMHDDNVIDSLVRALSASGSSMKCEYVLLLISCYFLCRSSLKSFITWLESPMVPPRHMEYERWHHTWRKCHDTRFAWMSFLWRVHLTSFL